jgi:hypothetical protein
MCTHRFPGRRALAFSSKLNDSLCLLILPKVVRQAVAAQQLLSCKPQLRGLRIQVITCMLQNPPPPLVPHCFDTRMARAESHLSRLQEGHVYNRKNLGLQNNVLANSMCESCHTCEWQCGVQG